MYYNVSMDVMSLRIDADTRRRMASLPEVNWAEVIRVMLREQLELEEETRRPLDRRRAIRAVKRMDRLRASVPVSRFDSAKEIRKWRDRRK